MQEGCTRVREGKKQGNDERKYGLFVIALLLFSALLFVLALPLFVIALLLFSALLCELPASHPMRAEPMILGAFMFFHDEPQVS